MMSAFVLMALLGVGLFASVFDGSGEGDEADDSTDGGEMPQEPAVPVEPETPVTDPSEPEVAGLSINASEDGDYLGSAGNDTVVISDDIGGSTIDTGAGNDTVSGIADPPVDFFGSIDTGSGDDLITIANFEGEIEGGAGDDTIIANGSGSVINGGAGDDHIVGSSGGDVLSILGGDGNDTLGTGQNGEQPFVDPSVDPLNGTSSTSVSVSGEAGDDLIFIAGPSSFGAAYFESGSGGEGNDTIVMAALPPNEEFGYSDAGSIGAIGGPGEDTFVIQTTDVVFEDIQEATVSEGFISSTLFEVRDFEPGVDVLQIEADARTEGGVLSSAALVESETTDGTITTLTLTYESTQNVAARINITLNASGVSWDDIMFVGEQMPELIPVVA